MSKKAPNIPSPESLREQLVYNPETGEIRWRNRRGKAPAFTTLGNQGYLTGTVFYRNMLAHRVAWALYYGKWPDKQIDHINGDRTDNRISNLRDVPSHINQRNRKRSKGASGVDGVRWVEKVQRWHVTIMHEYIGRFRTFEEVVAARKAEERKRGYHPNHGRPESGCTVKPVAVEDGLHAARQAA